MPRILNSDVQGCLFAAASYQNAQSSGWVLPLRHTAKFRFSSTSMPELTPETRRRSGEMADGWAHLIFEKHRANLKQSKHRASSTITCKEMKNLAIFLWHIDRTLC